MANISFPEKLVSVDLLGPQDIDEIKRYANKFRKVYNSQAYDEAVNQLHGANKIKGIKRADLYIDFCNKWSCRIGEDVREDASPVIRKVERLVFKMEKNLEEIEQSDLMQIIRPVNMLLEVNGIGLTITSKILSLAKPDLYVMIDQYICRELGFAANNLGYFHFLLLMRDVARHIRQVAKEAGESNLEEYLRPEDTSWNVPLAVYLDKWNWMKITYRGN